MLNNQNLEELLPIRKYKERTVVSGRELHSFLEAGKDFSSWMKVQINRCDLIENVDYQPLTQKGERSKGGKFNGGNKIEYALTIEAAKEIAMMSQCPKGKMARRYFIECERRLKEVFSLKDFISLESFCQSLNVSQFVFFGYKGNYKNEFINARGIWFMSLKLFEYAKMRADYKQMEAELMRRPSSSQLSLSFSDDDTEI